MLKNATPRQIALLMSLLISISGFMLFGLVFFSAEAIGQLWPWFLFPIISFALSYGFVIYVLKKYLYKKIKVIYKTIHQHKVSTSQSPVRIDVDEIILEDVEREVNEWVASEEAEIGKYKSWAEYRRRFIGDVSHELKTPIFNIQGYLHSLLDGGLEDTSVNEIFLRKAANNVDRLHTIVEDLSSISRLESGDLLLEMEVFDIKKLVYDIFEDIELTAKESQITLGFKLDADQSFMVRADKENIRQVLTNLIVNSIKYGHPEGSTKVGFYDMDKNILIEIADNGIGISPQHLPHVFGRFYRVDKSRSRLIGGSGLGLSIVKHIIEAHKQTISVRSTPDVGSTFSFTLEKV